MIDDRVQTFNLSKDEIEMLCHRRFGIGADGLILLQNAEGYDFKMVYYNADGGEGSMCGNGGRCIVRFAHDLGVFKTETSFIAVDGPHEASVTSDLVSLKMTDTAAVKEKDSLNFYDTGSPHVVKYIDGLDNFDVFKEGSGIRYSEFWKVNGGTNVNFVEPTGAQSIKVRTYERGVEAETFSCGTGVTACAIDRFVVDGCVSPISIVTLGGDLEVSFDVNADGSFSEIFLKGPAKRVFEGVLA
ncbi:UNVERIFIED_CONTAM: hypothetical protein GTU68_017481 [Idotea baltica]|nr:hypothetical protein [Idotea baltica]